MRVIATPLASHRLMPFALDPSFVGAAETKLGVMLPAEYRASMVRANGGCVEADGEVWWLHPIFDASDRTRIKRTSNDIIHETLEARAWSGFPPEAVAFAGNGPGDRLVFLPEPASGCLAPDVYRWDHETTELEHIGPSFGVLPWRP